MSPEPKATSRSERRLFGRFPVSGIYGSLRTAGDLKLLDLSRTGISFETANPLTVGKHYFLELRYGEAKVNLEVVVKWCAQRGTTMNEESIEVPIYQAGVGFVDIHRDAPGGLWAALRIGPG